MMGPSAAMTSSAASSTSTDALPDGLRGCGALPTSATAGHLPSAKAGDVVDAKAWLRANVGPIMRATPSSDGPHERIIGFLDPTRHDDRRLRFILVDLKSFA
jgi:hypothetical protein